MDRPRPGTHALTAATFHLEQRFRTPTSEQWSALLDDDTRTAARIDVHFDHERARVTVVMRDDLDEAAAESLLALVDAELVPSKARSDVRITVWRGRHEGTFAPE